MHFKSALVVTSLAAAFSCFAQNTIGTVQNVEGLVTYTDGTVGGTVANGSPIVSGTRFMASSSGSAVLRLNTGCAVRLQPNQAVTIDSSMSCPEMLAAVTAVTPAPGAGFASVGPIGVGAALLGAGALAVAAGSGNSHSISSE